MPSENWGNQKEWPSSDGVEFKRKDFTLKNKLNNMSMKEIRQFVKENNLSAKDTDKSELIEEIIKEMEDKK